MSTSGFEDMAVAGIVPESRKTALAQCEVSTTDPDAQLVDEKVAVGEVGTSGAAGKNSRGQLSRDSVGDEGSLSRS